MIFPAIFFSKIVWLFMVFDFTDEFLFSISEKNVRILIGNVLHLYVILGNMDILMILILQIPEYGRCLHLLMSSLNTPFFFPITCFPRPHSHFLKDLKWAK